MKRKGNTGTPFEREMRKMRDGTKKESKREGGDAPAGSSSLLEPATVSRLPIKSRVPLPETRHKFVTSARTDAGRKS